MGRLGWIIGGLILAAAVLFGSMLTIGGVRQRAASVARVPAAVEVSGLLHVPVAGVARSALRDSWGEAREGGARGHHGTDIPARGGTPVTAAGAGRVEKIFTSARGGLTLYQRSADGNWLYYYAHLSGYAPGIREGQELRAGDPVGFVGDTGDAGPGNTHLHFGLTRIGPGEHWWQGRDVDPFPALSGRRAGVAAGSATG